MDNNIALLKKSNKNTGFHEMLRKIKKQRSLLLMLLPGVIFFVVIRYLPYEKIYWAFTNYGDSPDVKFIGLQNFKELFASKEFIRVFFNTLIISFLNLIFGFPVPIIIALLLNEMKNKYVSKTIQTIIYLPNFISMVVVASIWYIALSPTNGFLVPLFNLLDQKPIFFMADSRYFRGILVASNIWKGAGFNAIIYLASMSSIDPQLYESAIIDGANKWRQAINITIPQISGTIATLLLLQLTGILNIFMQVLIMARPIVYDVANVVDLYAYQTGVQNMRLGYGTAINLFKALVSLILVIIANILTKKINGDEAVM